MSASWFSSVILSFARSADLVMCACCDRTTLTMRIMQRYGHNSRTRKMNYRALSAIEIGQRSQGNAPVTHTLCNGTSPRRGRHAESVPIWTAKFVRKSASCDIRNRNYPPLSGPCNFEAFQRVVELFEVFIRVRHKGFHSCSRRLDT
jgi:hypothetical protein